MTLIPRETARILRERFHRVILGAGYSEAAAQSILEEWFQKLMEEDIVKFQQMLTDYEQGRGDD